VLHIDPKKKYSGVFKIFFLVFVLFCFVLAYFGKGKWSVGTLKKKKENEND